MRNPWKRMRHVQMEERKAKTTICKDRENGLIHSQWGLQTSLWEDKGEVIRWLLCSHQLSHTLSPPFPAQTGTHWRLRLFSRWAFSQMLEHQAWGRVWCRKPESNWNWGTSALSLLPEPPPRSYFNVHCLASLWPWSNCQLFTHFDYIVATCRS